MSASNSLNGVFHWLDVYLFVNSNYSDVFTFVHVMVQTKNCRKDKYAKLKFFFRRGEEREENQKDEHVEEEDQEEGEGWDGGWEGGEDELKMKGRREGRMRRCRKRKRTGRSGEGRGKEEDGKRREEEERET